MRRAKLAAIAVDAKTTNQPQRVGVDLGALFNAVIQVNSAMRSTVFFK